MNKNDYVLHNIWRMNKKEINNFNIKKITNFGIALCMMFTIIFAPSVQRVKEVNTKVSSFDNYNANITKEDKIDYILNKYNLTKNEFNTLTAIVLSEAQSNSYEDAYAVINTIYNRTHAKNWVRSCSSYFGKNKGQSLYYQAIMPNQFVVYQHGTFTKYLNRTDLNGYNAVIDFLYDEKIMHNYLSFRANNIVITGSEKFSTMGNNYFNTLEESNRI